MWQWASHASGGGRNFGLRVFGSGGAVVFMQLQRQNRGLSLILASGD
jgi:hypothetical protein